MNWKALASGLWHWVRQPGLLVSLWAMVLFILRYGRRRDHRRLAR
jgi:hypothetical protein